MKTFRHLIASALVAALAFAAVVPAEAQVPSVNYVAPAQVQSYRASISGLVPAASATDFFTISGVAGHQVRVNFIKCSGISTAAATALINVVKRSTLNTTGTATTLTDVRLNSNNAAGQAIVKGYTVNPSALGTSIGQIDAGYLTTNTLASSAINNTGVTFNFENQQLFINEATTVVALNANATSLASGASLDCTIEWSEQ